MHNNLHTNRVYRRKFDQLNATEGSLVISRWSLARRREPWLNDEWYNNVHTSQLRRSSGRGPSSPFCPPLSTVRRQCTWRPWRTSGQSNRIVSAYDRPCPPLSAGGRQASSAPGGPRALFVRSWPARSGGRLFCTEPFQPSGAHS